MKISKAIVFTLLNLSLSVSSRADYSGDDIFHGQIEVNEYVSSQESERLNSLDMQDLMDLKREEEIELIKLNSIITERRKNKRIINEYDDIPNELLDQNSEKDSIKAKNLANELENKSLKDKIKVLEEALRRRDELDSNSTNNKKVTLGIAAKNTKSNLRDNDVKGNQLIEDQKRLIEEARRKEKAGK